MDDDNDKPFVCSHRGCGMRFANSDHLSVHKQKHQLMISIGTISGENLVDQTPTPTRFVKDVDADLFSGEIPTNPFDQGFREAAAKNEQSMKPPSTSAPVLSNGSGTPTPVGTPPLKRPRVKVTPNLLQNVLSIATNTNTAKASKGVSSIQTKSEASAASSTEIKKESQPKASQPSETSGTKSKPVVQISAKTNIAAIIANPTTQFVKANMPVPGQKGLTLASAVMLSVPTPAIVTSPMPPALQNSGSSHVTKQKLKKALEQNSRTTSVSVQPSNTSHSSTYGTPDLNGDNSNGFNDVDFSYADSGSGSPGSAAASPESQDASKRGPMKRARRNQEDLDPDERRKKFLERNRAAASRCRQKRKIWVQQLEKKADELSLQNGQLQNEIALLRTEVAQLKALLLTHKDCSVTQQQKAMMDQVGSTFMTTPENQVVKTQGLPAGNSLKVTSAAEEVATSALTDMATRAPLELKNRGSTPSLSLSDKVLTTNGSVCYDMQ